MVTRAVMISGNSKSSLWTVEAMKKYFDEVDHLYIKHVDINFSGEKAEVLYKGKPLKEYDCLFVKGSFRYAQLLRSISSLFWHNEHMFIPIKPSAFTIAHDKLLTQLILQQKNLPMPRTYLSSTVEAAKDVLSKMTYPIIMKFPQGTQGKGVMFADSFASASSILDALHALKQPFIIQEYVETNSSDVRLIVIGDKVVAAMRRKSGSVDKRANLHAGGVGEAFVPDEKMKRIAVQAAQSIGAGICGVDILESHKGPLIIELNISPGLQGITGATGVDVADLIAKYLYTGTVARLEVKKSDVVKEIMADLNTPLKNPSEDEILDTNGNGSESETITQLDMRAGRILLPEFVTKKSSLNEDDSVQLKVSKGKFSIEKFM